MLRGGLSRNLQAALNGGQGLFFLDPRPRRAITPRDGLSRAISVSRASHPIAGIGSGGLCVSAPVLFCSGCNELIHKAGAVFHPYLLFRSKER
jgi:hypothetical protein